jgi:hypothetical protein
VIVRIATEGQYRLAEDQLPRLHELDGAVIAAAESGDPERFEQRFAELLECVRTGELLGDEHLGPFRRDPPPARHLARGGHPRVQHRGPHPELGQG